MNKNTKHFIEQFEDLNNRAAKLCSNLTNEKFNTKPAPDRWSIGECIQHLIATSELYLPAVDKSIFLANKKGLFSDAEFKPRFIQGKLIKALEPPYKKRVKTFEIFNPKSDLDIKETIELFIELNNGLIGKVKDSDGLNLRKAVLVSPVSKLIRLKLGEAFLLITTHARRHLWQAEQVIEHL